MKAIINTCLGGSLRAGLSAASHIAIFAFKYGTVAFRFNPCRSVCLIFTMLLYCQSQCQVMTLDSALTILERQNLMLQEYNDKMSAYQSYAEGALAQMPPMVGLGTFMTPYRMRESMPDEKGAVMVSVEQQLINPAKLHANQQYLKSKVAVEKETREVKLNELRYELKSTYFAWLINLEQEKLIRQNLRLVQHLENFATLQLKATNETPKMILQLNQKAGELSNELEMIQGEAEEFELRLKRLLNLNSSRVIQPDTSAVLSFDARQSDTTQLASRRSDIRQLDRTIDAMISNNQWRKVQLKPDLRLRFDHMQSLGTMPAQFTAMAMITIPIAPWSRPMVQAETKGMQFEIAAMKKSREALLQEKQAMVNGMVVRLKRMKTQLDNYASRIIPAVNANYQIQLKAFTENRADLVMVLEAFEANLMTQLDALEKKSDYYTMIIDYEKELNK